MNIDKAYNIINTAKEGLKYKNRFSVDKEFNGYLDRYIESKQGDRKIGKEFELFRARLYLEPDQYEKYNKPTNDIFQGYDAMNSFVNLTGDTSEGRINPRHIAYLYVSTSVDGAITEVRPYANTLVSVAKIKVITDMQILDFSRNSTYSDGANGSIESTLFLYINNEFSKPCYKEGDYLLLQYISEYIKGKGYDGVMYASAFSRNTYLDKSPYENIAIFNYNECKAVDSKLYMVDKIIPIKHALCAE